MSSAKRSRAAFAALLAASGLATSANAGTILWSGSIGNWNDPANWTGGVVPSSVTADVGEIDNGGTAIIDATQGALSTGSVTLGNTGTQVGNLQMTGGSLTTTNTDIRIGGNSLTGAGTGTFTQSGGSVTMNAGNLNIGQGSAGAVGTYNMSGGSLVVNSANIMAVGNRGTGTVNQTGGSIYVRGSGAGTATAVVQLGRNTAALPGSGTYTLGGGSLAAFNTQFGNAVGGTGSTNLFTLSGTGKLITNNISIINTGASNTFNFIGGTLNANNVSIPLVNNGGAIAPGFIDFANSTVSAPTQNALGTTFFTGNDGYAQNATGFYAVDIGGIGSNDVIDAGAGSNTGSITLAGSINVNLLNGFDPALGSTFDIATADTLTSAALVNGTTPSGNRFTPSIVTGGDGRQVLRLTVTAVPEPGSLVLMAGASFALAYRRPKRQPPFGAGA